MRITSPVVIIFLMLSLAGCKSTDWQQVRQIVATADATVTDYQLLLGPADPLTAKLEKIHPPARAVIAAIDSGAPNDALVELALATARQLIEQIEDPKKRNTAARVYVGVVIALRLAGVGIPAPSP